MNEPMKFWNEPNLSETDVKRQHYVPQFLLRKFSENGIIRVINLQDNSEVRTSIKNVAVETNFYDIEINNTPLSTENWLAQLESEAAPIIEKLLDDPDRISTLTDIEEIHIA